MAYNSEQTAAEVLDMSNGQEIEPAPRQIITRLAPMSEEDSRRVVLNFDPRPGRIHEVFMSFVELKNMTGREANAVISEFGLDAEGNRKRTNQIVLWAEEWHMVADACLSYLAATIPAGKVFAPESDEEKAQANEWNELIDAINLVRAHILSTNYGQEPQRIPY